MTDAPTTPRPKFHDETVELLVGNLLRIGVLIAAAVTFIGGVFYVAQNAFAPAGHHVFVSEPTDLRSVQGVIAGLAHLQPAAIVQFGLVLLIATPIARVALTLVAFLIQRDKLYVLITAIVLALLLYSLAG